MKSITITFRISCLVLSGASLNGFVHHCIRGNTLDAFMCAAGVFTWALIGASEITFHE